MNRWSSGNGMIPSDEEFDRHWAPKCEECGVKLTKDELREGEVCFECAPFDDEPEDDDDE